MSEHPHMARLEDVARFAERLPDGYLMCRTWAHAWDQARSTVRRSDGRVSWTVECSTCGTVRTRVMTTGGEIVANRYTYPEGYQSDGIGRIGQSGLALIRMESLRRLNGA
ncbi:hypothetical protein HNP84_009991 [Thermocatellispora tengchongensis]|uniref:Uncharacterized protein n=1 Tax=Thermocatellispora tengchongensis TaxID=1073253 RepID=A0A840PFN4_9ACTN|nr:hypothetical protein [Thermocatellispora tengchongensis]MBB5140224.1 hypothetical protein [Thermocatellispora tengchongensis]